MKMTFSKAVPLAVAALLGGWGVAEALPISSFGTPVTSITSSTGSVPNCPTLEGQSCFNTETGSVSFFIPLSTTHAGVFGVTNVGDGLTAGTSSDVGGGTENANALTMYLRFSPVAPDPLSLATLRFDFIDFDLQGGNDPNGFLESVKFFDDEGNALTSRITMLGQTPSPGGLQFTVTGNYNSQSIFFPDVIDLVQEPFFMELRFRSSYTGTGRNTIESMISTLTTETAPPSHHVPEPGTLGLVGAGLLVIAAMLRPRGRRGPRKDPSE